jgi:glycine/D-amino acid oxidase-like deaminating enzyme
MKKTYDFVVIGAGVFGAWIARCLQQAGEEVALVDAYGPGNSRSSSGGETRVIRMGYGPDELYTQWAQQSLPAWEELELQVDSELLHRTGVLWLSNDSDEYTKSMLEVFTRNHICCEQLDAITLRQRYPELKFDDVTWGLLEPGSGLLMARRAVQLLVYELEKSGVPCIHNHVLAPEATAQLGEIKTAAGETISAGHFIFSCGPWLPRIFPQLLNALIFPSRQEVFFLGSPPGDDGFRPPKMPVWLNHQHPDIPYALPDIEGHGYKIAFDRHGPAIDPDSAERVVSGDSIVRLRTFLGKHLPRLANAPILETRVCQYENTWNGDFLIDRHPEFENVWLVGGGSGHGFKHGPAVGSYVTGLVLRGAAPEKRFLLASKQYVQARAVY